MCIELHHRAALVEYYCAMDWGTQLAHFAQYLLDHYGVLGIALIIFIEECGVPSPMPADLLLLVAGHQIATGRIHPLQAVALVELAAIGGASILYALSRRAGRPFLFRYGRFVRLDLARLEQAEGFLQRHGAIAIAVGRITPGLRIATTLVAGSFAVPFPVFLPAFAVGALAYSLFFIALGAFVATPTLDLLAHIPIDADLASSIVGAALLGYLAVRLARSRSGRSSAVARPVRAGAALAASLLGGVE